MEWFLDTWLVWVTFGVALVFDFVNGFHDAANSIATVVTTRVLSPRFAVAWAAFFNLAAVMFGTEVAKKVATGVVDPGAVTVPVILAGLIGAIAWNLLTWWWTLPSSSSHALIGGYAGAALVAKGAGALYVSNILWIASFIAVAPVVGMGLGVLNQLLVAWLSRKASPRPAHHLYRRLQLVSSAIYSFSHGSNDAQKTAGILFALLLVAKNTTTGGPSWLNDVHAEGTVPFWVVLACFVTIAAGTLSGGYRIVKTMGSKLTKLTPMNGFCAETGGGVTILAVSHFGIPVSTTHTIAGAIVGVGVTGGVRGVRWIMARRILWAWIFTIPASAAIAALTYLAFSPFVAG